MIDDPNIRMIDVGDKQVSSRQATTRGSVVMKSATFDMIKKGTLPKGDVLAVAKVAGILAAKQTHLLIPMCHPIPIDVINVELALDEKTSSVEIRATVRGSAKTGYEMEALTAVSIAALTIYDMCKGMDPTVKITDIRLVSKSGGKSGNVVLE
jgi:cyclic pyranopterin phosphate synthase